MKNENVIEIVRTVDQLMVPQNFVGIGSTRKVFRFKHWVIKKHLHEIGYLQSQNEQKIHHALKVKGLASFVAPILYLDEKISIQPYVQALPLVNGETFDIDFNTDLRISANLKTAIEEIDRVHDGFDFLDSSNYGEDERGQLILIDYGMTKTLYESKWVPLADAGVLPQIYFEPCIVCGVEKELRIYGEHDTDRRCYECGKE